MTRQNTAGELRIPVRLVVVFVIVLCILAFVPAMGTTDHTDDHTRAIYSDNVTITLGDNTPGAQTTHDWTIQVTEEFEEVDRIELRYRNADSVFDEDISKDDLVGGNINIVGGGELPVDAVYEPTSEEDGTDDIWMDINDSSLAAGQTIEIAWKNDVFTNPPETGSDHISMEMRDFDDDYIGSGVGSVFIPGEIEVTDLEVTNTDSNQLSEYQFEFSVKDHPIDNLWRIRADFSDAYEDGLDFDDMDMDFDTDDIWVEDADGNDLDPFFEGTVYGTEDVLEFSIDPDRLETDAGDGPYTFGFKNITNPDPGTDYDVEIRIRDRWTDTGPMAADNATFGTVESPTMLIKDTNLTHSTTFDPGKYEIDVAFAAADADDVDGFAVEFIDAADIDADDLTAADVDVNGADVDTVTTDTDEVKLELAEPVTYQENEQATIVLDGVTNPSEIGDFDVEVEFFAYGNSYGNDTLADAFTIEPSLEVGNWESPRSVTNGSLSPNSFTVENIGEADMTGIQVYLGADSEEDAFKRPATFGAAPESWSDEAIDAGETKVYEYDLMTADYFDIGENYDIGEDFYHGPAAGLMDGWSFVLEDADSQPFYISESDQSGSITASVANETGHAVDGAQVDLYVHEVAPENLVASEESADSTVTFDESHPDVDDGLAVGTEKAEAVEYIVVADKDGHEEATQTTALYEGNLETSVEITLTEIEPATFELWNYLVHPTELDTGEELWVSTNVTNIGEEFGVETIRLKYDGDEATNESVALDPDEFTTVSLTADAPDQEGEYNLTVETTDDQFSETINVTEPEPATFELSNYLVHPTELETGEELFARTNVTNVGEEFGVDTVRLKYDGVEVTNGSVALDPDERTTVYMDADAPDDAGEYNLTVETTDDQFAETLNVTEPKPATFEITRFDIFTTELEPGEEFLVIANVTNTGDEFGVDTARLQFDGEEVTNESIALDPGERTTVSYAVDAPEDEGEYTVSVETDDDQPTGDITVGPKFKILDADMPTDVGQGHNVTVTAHLENVGSHGTQNLNFTVYAPEQEEDNDDDGEDGDTRTVESVAVVDDPANATQGQVLVDVLDDEFETADLVTNDNLLDEMGDYEVIVMYRFDSDSLATDFLDQLDDDQGVVYLDDHQVDIDSESWSDGVHRLNNVRSDPADWESHYIGVDTNPAEVTITAEHPIFDGVGEVGDTLVMNEGDNTWGSIFAEYSGDIIAEVDYSPSEPGEYDGPGIGVNDAENEVLLSALSYDLFNGPGDITDAGAGILINSIEHVGPVTDDGEENNGEYTYGTEQSFPFFGEVVIHVSDDITLDAGETAPVELEYEVPENLAPDRYTQELSTESDDGVSELWVELYADIEVSSYSLDPDPVEEVLHVGDTLTTEAVVANHGEKPGEFEVEYIHDEEVVANQTVEVGGEATEIVELDHELWESGTKIVSVNGVDPVQLTVESEPIPAPDPDPLPDPDTELDSDPDPDRESEVVVNSTATNTSVSVSDAKAGDPVSIPIAEAVGDDGTALDALNVTSGVDSDFNLTIEASTEPPEDTEMLPNNAAGLLYLDIESSLEEDEIENVTFEFTVPSEVLDERDLDPTAATLFHRVDGEWQEHETTIVDENGEYTFQATAPHFSVFAIAGNQPGIEIVDTALSASEISVGEEVIVEVDLEDAGGGSESDIVDVFVDGEPTTSKSVTLAAGERKTVTLSVGFDDAGEFDLAVNDYSSSLLIVEAAAEDAGDTDSDDYEDVDDEIADPDEGDDDQADEDNSDGFGPGFGLIVAIIGVVGGGYLFARRADSLP